MQDEGDDSADERASPTLLSPCWREMREEQRGDDPNR